MNANDLMLALRGKIGNKIDFTGVISSDQIKNIQIPLVREKPISFISNILRGEDKRLGHWIVFLISESPRKYIYFFDSYGLKPDLYSLDFRMFLSNNSDFEVYTFNKKLQSSTSLVCGLYCSYFIYHISRYALNKVISIINQTFHANQSSQNDKRVYEFYVDKLNSRPCQYWKNREDAIITYEQCLGIVNERGS